jgi:predicted SPOUT superfamily RNA methylase MTH1
MTSIEVAIPSSVLSVEPGLILKTIKIYQFIRYSSIFRVDKIIIYRDPYTGYRMHRRYARLFDKIHRYLTTPPYLRRKIIPLDDDLRYVGLLPPLRLEAYNVSKDIRRGEKRVGLLVEDEQVDIGAPDIYKIINSSSCIMSRDRLVYVEVVDPGKKLVECLDEKPYMGPQLISMNSLNNIFKEKNSSEVVIATSRYGRIPGVRELEELGRYSIIRILFGSPKHGLQEIAGELGLVLENTCDYVWNTIPGQGVKTVRTEEALLATLSILNIFINR